MAWTPCLGHPGVHGVLVVWGRARCGWHGYVGPRVLNYCQALNHSCHCCCVYVSSGTRWQNMSLPGPAKFQAPTSGNGFSTVKDMNTSPTGKGCALQNPINKGAPQPRERPMTGSMGAWGIGAPLMAAPGRFQLRNLRSSRNSQKIPEASGAKGPQNSPPWSWSLWSVVTSGDKRVPSAGGTQ